MTRSTRIVTCTRCNGAGRYYQQRELVECPNCGGRGELVEEFESHALDDGRGCARTVAMLALVCLTAAGLIAHIIA